MEPTMGLTFEKVWALFEESDRKFQEDREQMERSKAEHDRRWEESKAEHDRQWQESKAEHDREMKELRKQMKETDKRIAAVTEQLSGMGNSNGAFAEEYFAGALGKKMEFAGQHFDDIAINLKGKRGSLQDQFDVVMYNGIAVAIVEVKYKVQTKDLETIAEKKAHNFRTLFPYYANHIVYLGVGSMSFNEYVYTKARELGIGLLKPNGDSLEIDYSYVKAY
jgi:hypothetical protein